MSKWASDVILLVRSFVPEEEEVRGLCASSSLLALFSPSSEIVIILCNETVFARFARFILCDDHTNNGILVIVGFYLLPIMTIFGA